MRQLRFAALKCAGGMLGQYSKLHIYNIRKKKVVLKTQISSLKFIILKLSAGPGF